MWRRPLLLHVTCPLKNLMILLYVFDWLHLIILLFFSCISHRPLLFAVSNTVSSNIVKVISINPSAIVVVFDDFNNHPLDYWTNYGGTKRPVVLCYKFFISTDLTQTCNSPSRIIHRDSQSCSFGFIFNFRV